MFKISDKCIRDHVIRQIIKGYDEQLVKILEENRERNYGLGGSECMYPYSPPSSTILNLHTYNDWKQAGYISEKEEETIITNNTIELYNTSSTRAHYIANDRRVGFDVMASSKNSDYLLQIQLFAKSLEDLETIIHSIMVVEIEENDQRIDRIYEPLLKLEWEILKLQNKHIKKSDGFFVFPIFKHICTPDRPHPLFFSESLKLYIEFTSLGIYGKHNDLSTIEFVEGSCLRGTYLITKKKAFPPNEGICIKRNDGWLTTEKETSIKRLIGQWQFTGKEYLPHCKQSKLMLNFNHPVTCLLMFITADDEIISEFEDVIESISLYLDYDRKIENVYGGVLSDIVPKRLGLSTLEKSETYSGSKAYYVISFNGQNPFGDLDVNKLDNVVNFSNIKRAVLEVTLKEDLDKNIDLNMSIMAFSINTIYHDIKKARSAVLYSY